MALRGYSGPDCGPVRGRFARAQRGQAVAPAALLADVHPSAALKGERSGASVFRSGFQGLVTAALPEAVRAAGTPVEVWFQDEARVGQQGTLTYVWAKRGSRPRAPKDLRYEWAYIFGAVCAERGVGAALVLPHTNTDAMTLHLAEISRHVAAGAHAVIVLDGAGWRQTGGRLRVPDNVTLLHLPPYSPELNPVEVVWEYLRANTLSNSVFDTYNAIVDRCCDAWTWLTDTPDRIQSIADVPWTKTVNA